MPREYFEGTWQKNRSFTPAVTTQGGRMVFAAGHGAIHDDDGKSLAGDFAAQARQAFTLLDRTLQRSGARLKDLTTVTVFIIDTRFGNDFVEIRKEFFPDGKFPASALITVAGFAHPHMMVEIQGIAVVD
jgi:2-iminobutanoate/2-iminopropanoate deaminase